MADAAYAILNEPAAVYSGQFLIDDEVLAAKGVTDFEPYSHTAGAKLFADIFVDPTARVPGGIELSAYR
jgi:citronellol/citronellal dehydrogenase